MPRESCSPVPTSRKRGIDNENHPHKNSPHRRARLGAGCDHRASADRAEDEDDHGHSAVHHDAGQGGNPHRHAQILRRLPRQGHRRGNVYDNLDFQRGVQAYLTALPAVSIEGARKGVTGFGSVNQTVLISEQLLNSKSLFLTANTTTPYSVLYLDTKDGPLVLEIPPEVLGPMDDAWFRWVTDVGFTGPDKGAGGKYLLLPPGYTGEVPEGYFVARSRTFGNLLFSELS